MENKIVNVYHMGTFPVSSFPTGKEKHSTTYLELEIPVKIEKKLNTYISKQIKEFHKTCKCDYCKLKRSKNKK